MGAQRKENSSRSWRGKWRVPSKAVGVIRKRSLVEIKSPCVYRTVLMNHTVRWTGESRERIRASV